MREGADFNKPCNLIGSGSGRNFFIQHAHGGRNPSRGCASLCDDLKRPIKKNGREREEKNKLFTSVLKLWFSFVCILIDNDIQIFQSRAAKVLTSASYDIRSTDLIEALSYAGQETAPC